MGSRPMRWRKADHEHNVLVAISRWVKSKGGNLVVVGGIEVQDFHEGAGKFKVAVRCLGKMPPRKPDAE